MWLLLFIFLSMHQQVSDHFRQTVKYETLRKTRQMKKIRDENTRKPSDWTLFVLGLKENVNVAERTLPPQRICAQRPRCPRLCRCHHKPPRGQEVCP